MLTVHRDPQNPFAPKITAHIERLMRSRQEILEGAGQKRQMAEQQVYGDGNAKRQKIAERPAPAQPNPLAPPAGSLAALFTLSDHIGLQAFDALQVPAALAAKIAVSTLARVDPQALDKAIQAVRERFDAKVAAAPPVLNPETAPLDVEDDDDYEPDYMVAEDTEQILNKLDGTSREDLQPQADAASLALGPYKLPAPPPLNPEAAAAAGQVTVARVFDALKVREDPSAKKSRAGMNRLAASAYDKDALLTFIARMGTRSNSGLEDVDVKDESKAIILRNPLSSNAIRERMYTYVLEDFRKRIDVAVAWLCEEWYNDKLSQKESQNAPLHYEKTALKLVDGFFPYLNPQDKVLMRFLGEIPVLNKHILAKVKSLCADPSMVQLALTSLLYLVMMKPPVRDTALDTVQDVWLECESSLVFFSYVAVLLTFSIVEDARPMAAKYLTKWRPGFIESQTGGGGHNAAALPPPVAA